MTDLDIGEPASFTDTDDGSTNGEGSLILLGTLALDYVNDSYSREYDLSNGPVALARARPGIEAIQGGAQVYKIIEFTGSGTRPVKFDITVDFNVQAIAADGDANLTTKTFAYDFYNKEHLEKDKNIRGIRPRNTPPVTLVELRNYIRGHFCRGKRW